MAAIRVKPWLGVTKMSQLYRGHGPLLQIQDGPHGQRRSLFRDSQAYSTFLRIQYR